MIPVITTPVKVSSNDLIGKSFDAIIEKSPKDWTSPSIYYKRWSAARRNRYSYYSSRYKNIPVEEHEIRNVVHYLNPDNLDKITEASLETAKKVPAVKKLLTMMQLNFINEFLRVSKNLLEDKVKSAAHKAAQAEKKRLAKIKKEKAKAEANKVATKNKELLASLCLTPEQKAILKKIAC